MTSAIAAIAPPPSVSFAEPAGGVTGAAQAAMGAQAPAGLGDRFRDALAQARLVPEQGAHIQGPSMVSEAVTAQDEAFGALTEKIDAFEASSGSMSMQQVEAQSLQIQHEITEQMVKIYTGTAVAQGGKSTVQTLMKNQ
ncbi:MAG TPA: hypothetical protein VGL01_08775 [Trinickia sp.]|jgi:type III secretion inner rod protein HrpB2|uniref:hypothetical protein n=1 Tax=Trinickia sp. TaxID=2571163 RepID=UPI002F3F564A